MATVHDIAAYILEKEGPMTAMKLQKLLYYCQAWALVWEDKPLFRARIEAWANGPVIPSVYARHRGQFEVSTWEGNLLSLTAGERETVDAVLGYYGKYSSLILSQLTHNERPWLEARRGLAPGERGKEEITHAAMAEYYGSLVS
ncbi:MAG TPA: hypothetical protein DD490_33655 [Acidobacteria bacterium]|nr:hypothetical protein [Acidobacteriota bacterium]